MHRKLMPQMAVALIALVALGTARADDCPPLEQPALSQGLAALIRVGRPDDALVCIWRGLESAEQQGVVHSDEVAYQLAKQASDAIETLGDGATVAAASHVRAATLWRRYLDNVSKPYDLTRITFGTRKIEQHARFGDFLEFATAIVAAIGKLERAVPTDFVNQFFTTLYRCREWNRPLRSSASDKTYASAVCAPACRTEVTNLSQRLLDATQPAADASPGSRALASNAAKLKERLQCTDL